MVDSVMTSVHLDLLAPLSGVMVPLESVPNPVFSGKLVGDGISIDPTSSELLAPVAGTVTQLHSAHHAIAITSEAGMEVLLHIGLDTVMLKGEGCTAKVKLGDRVDPGQPLISFDPVIVGRKARSLLTQMVITNGERIESMQPVTGMVVVGKDMALHLVLREPAAEAAPVDGETVQSRIVIFRNTFGLHARPAAILAAAKKFRSVVRPLRGAAEVNAKSVEAAGVEAIMTLPDNIRDLIVGLEADALARVLAL